MRPQGFEYHSGDYFRVWQENGEKRMMMSTFILSQVGNSIHTRLTDEVASALAEYLEETGFTDPIAQ